ncbi:RING-box protein 2 isoform X2 [Myripristis murdjan]|uniref:RING-box protein 2 isoform X2 n=1 Tax=Myripristis murdjan TaxID=586833 RepID=UPI001175C95F|nr:RING-box protein 2 isoform X2 [Myripristis murdjan]
MQLASGLAPSILFSWPSYLTDCVAEMDEGDEPGLVLSHNTSSGSKSGGDKMFSLKKWNAVAMWSWDVECDTCAICRVQTLVSDARLKINKRTVLWYGESATTPSITAACPFG